jgi:transposase
MTQTNQLFTRGELLGQYLTKFQRRLLEQQLDIEIIPEYRQRIEIMLLADDGQTQTQICRVLGCSPVTARHWILMAKSGHSHNWQEQPIGRPKTINAEYVNRLKELVSKSPKAFDYPFPRWTGQWLSKHLAQEFDIEVSPRHINRLIKEIEVEIKLGADLAQQQSPQLSKSRHLIIADLHEPTPIK